MNGHIIVFGHDALANQIIGEFNDAGLRVVTLPAPTGLRAAGVAAASAVVAASGRRRDEPGGGSAGAQDEPRGSGGGPHREPRPLTEDDMVNIETALVLRETFGADQVVADQVVTERPIPIVLRIYDRDLEDAVGDRLGFTYVRSTVDLSTPWFVAAARGLEVLGTFSVGQSSFMVGGLET